MPLVTSSVICNKGESVLEEITYEERISKYSLDELLGVEKRIDKNSHPERYKLVLEEIEKRKVEGDPVLVDYQVESPTSSSDLLSEINGSVENKKPKLVWVIFVWFVLGGLLATYNFYTMYIGEGGVPEGFERPNGALYYLYAFGAQFFAMAAAILLFMRKVVSKWLFSILFGVTLLNSAYSIIFGSMPEQYKVEVIATLLFSLLIYGLITWYAFNLEKKEYYVAKSI